MTPTLPQWLYLLSHEPAKSRLDDDSAAVRGTLLRVAAVADLCIDGRLAGRDGKVTRADGTLAPPSDPFLAEVLGDVPADGPRRWFGVIDQRWHKAEATVRDGLAATGVVTAERRRILGMFPTHRIGVPDPEPARARRTAVRAVALGEIDPAAAPVGDVVLAVLADQGNVRTVFRRRELRAARQAVRAVNDRFDDEFPGLRSALDWAIAARRSATA